MLATPFVIHSQPTGVFESRAGGVAQMAEEAHRRYAEIMKDVEDMIDDHSKCLSICFIALSNLLQSSIKESIYTINRS